MAQRVQVVMTDDIDGGVADETVSFGLDGSGYEIDLSSANAEKLRDTLAPYLGAARRSGRSGGRRTRSGLGPSQPAERRNSGENAVIREWAKANGQTVSERGRISGQVRDAYAAATI